MARKVFISFLGTNNYVETKYIMPDGQISDPVRFIQEALILHDCADWSENDKIYIFCTKQATKKNVEDNGHDENQIKEDIERIGLKHRLQDNYKMNNIVSFEPIPEGFSEEEIWNIFDTVFSKLCPGDEIYFDVTHAFRSIPLFSTVLFNYSRFMLDTKVICIQYGAFEKLGPAFDVRKLDVNDRIAPIIDLTNVVRLQQFTDMASSLTNFGRVNKISETLEKYAGNNQNIIKLQKGIEEFDNYIATNKIGDIKEGKWFKKIKEAIRQVRKSNLPVPIKNIVAKLDKDLSAFKPCNSNDNVEAAIEWTKKYKMLPSAYTIGQEYIISLLEEKWNDKNPYACNLKLSERDKKIKFRLFISAVCSISNADIVDGKFKAESEKCELIAKEMWSCNQIQELRKSFAQLGNNRNTVNHAKKTDISYQKLVEDFNIHFYNCLNAIKYADKSY